MKFYQAPAKLNLTLDVISKRPDGYHNIKTIIHEISLFDAIGISIAASDETQIVISSNKRHLKTNPSNTIYKASMAFLTYINFKASVKIVLNKRIPIGAGLGGGSSNAATVIKLLDKYLQANLSEDELISLALKVGSDVPFFIRGGCQLVQGKGEILTHLTGMAPYPIIICKPKQSIKTRDLFEAIKPRNLTHHPDTESAIDAIRRGDLEALARCCYNVFTPYTEKQIPIIKNIKIDMMTNNALCAEMTGTGSAVYAIFESQSVAQTAYSLLSKKYNDIYLVEFLNTNKK